MRLYLRAWLFAVLFLFSLNSVLVTAVNAEVVIMPLGDSVTKGSNSGAVPDQEDFYVAYRQYLLDKLRDESYDVNFVGSQDDGFGVAGFDDSEHEGHGGFHAAGEPNGDNILPNVQDWLIDQQNDGFPTGIVLLHIGTNDISNDGEDANEIEGILDEIEQYDPNTVVCLARIINRLDGKSQATTDFNESVQLMVDNRIDPPVVVDMENAAGIIYDLEGNGGDMNDDIHPFETGYEKMSEAWFNVCLQNVLPRADAGPDQDADEGSVVTLDGSGSLDPRGGNLFYLWEQETGSAVTLSDDRAVMPTFTAPDVGSGGDTLTFKLTVTDETLLLESTDTTSVTVTNNTPPVANAGPNQSVSVGETVTLDGSGSTDVDGDPLTYAWSFDSVPAGSTATLSDPTAVMPTFVADEAGTYEVQLIVNDGSEDSAPDTVTITATQPSSGGGGGGGGGGCFIATAAGG